MKANLVIEPPGHRAAKVKVLGLLFEIVNVQVSSVPGCERN
jgi:hypothetical protein